VGRDSADTTDLDGPEAPDLEADTGPIEGHPIRYTEGGLEGLMTTVRATVEIFGQRLGLRADGDATRLEELARFVDSRMREVADRSSSVDTVKIAVLTALNIADELFQERESDQDTRHKRLEEQAERLVSKLEEAMKSGEAREQT
jgi:cell division protein ZapA